MRRNLVDSHASPPDARGTPNSGRSAGQPTHERRQLEEIGDAEMRVTGGHDDGRILGNGAGPAGGQAAGLAGLVHVDDPVLGPEVTVVDEVVLASPQRVKRVRHPETSALSLRIGCS